MSSDESAYEWSNLDPIIHDELLMMSSDSHTKKRMFGYRGISTEKHNFDLVLRLSC